MDLWEAAEKGNIERVRKLLSKSQGSSFLNGRDEQRRTPLHIAALYGQADICRFALLSVE